MNFSEVVKNFENECFQRWGEYIKLHDELDTYRGKPIKHEDSERIGDIVMEIQKMFNEMRPLLLFVVEKYPVFVKAIKEYELFIEDIKKAGAIEVSK